MGKDYRICTRCVMDTTDPDITFDERGVCSHCLRYDQLIRSGAYLRKQEPSALERLIDQIKKRGKAKNYDCIIGVSGGVDSTYVAYLTKSLGLRPLAVHLDNGWDSELAVRNIEKTLNKLGIDLYTYVMDWEEFRTLQLAFLKASTPEAEIPTDHAILAILYEVAAREGIKYILSGHNVATESAGVAAWAQGHGDWLYIKSVNREQGTRSLKSFPHYGPWGFIYYTLIKRIRFIPILDYTDYKKSVALDVLEKELNWQYYGGKHYESIYTRFYRGYYLPKKFGFEKKREDLSSLIWSGQITRKDALLDIQKSNYPEEMQKQDVEYVTKKLGITEEDFQDIMASPPKCFWDYPSYKKILRHCRPIVSVYHLLKRS